MLNSGTMPTAARQSGDESASRPLLMLAVAAILLAWLVTVPLSAGAHAVHAQEGAVKAKLDTLHTHLTACLTDPSSGVARVYMRDYSIMEVETGVYGYPCPSKAVTSEPLSIQACEIGFMPWEHECSDWVAA